MAEADEESVDTHAAGLNWLAEHGDALFAYAMTRVSNRAIAEDLVQETFLSAVKNFQQFKGASSPRTWLLGILRHKVFDHFRSVSRRKQATEGVSADEFVGDRPDPHGRHYSRKHWGSTPETAFVKQEFWQVFDHCREGLPAHLGRAFVLREMDDMETDAICEILGVKPSNLAVRVHRARLLLRECLENNWFAVD